MQPMPDVIIIKADDVKKQTASGLYVKQDWSELPPIGTIESVGSNVTDVKPGDRVVYKQFGTTQIQGNFRCANIQHIIAIINE